MQRIENTTLKRYMHIHINCSIIHKSQDMETFKCPSMDEWINRILLNHEKEWNLAICDKMDEPLGSDTR